MTPPSYHARHCLTQQQLINYEESAATQDQLILKIFQSFHTVKYSAEDILLWLHDPMLVTSIRRSLTNLERRGLIEKTGTVTGQYGRPINQYQAVRE